MSVPTQTCSQTELENWITAIHSACATAVARQHHREDTVRLLRAEIKKLEQKIDMDEKMKKMGDMQLSAVTDTKKRKTILDQVGLKLLSHMACPSYSPCMLGSYVGFKYCPDWKSLMLLVGETSTKTSVQNYEQKCQSKMTFDK